MRYINNTYQYAKTVATALSHVFCWFMIWDPLHYDCVSKNVHLLKHFYFFLFHLLCCSFSFRLALIVKLCNLHYAQSHKKTKTRSILRVLLLSGFAISRSFFTGAWMHSYLNFMILYVNTTLANRCCLLHYIYCDWFLCRFSVHFIQYTSQLNAVNLFAVKSTVVMPLIFSFCCLCHIEVLKEIILVARCVVCTVCSDVFLAFWPHMTKT